MFLFFPQSSECSNTCLVLSMHNAHLMREVMPRRSSSQQQQEQRSTHAPAHHRSQREWHDVRAGVHARDDRVACPPARAEHMTRGLENGGLDSPKGTG